MSHSLLSKPPKSLRWFCVMCNHFHLLLEVTPPAKEEISDELLLKRLGSLYSPAFVATVAEEVAEARAVVAQGLARDGEAYVQRIPERFTYRMLLLEEGQEVSKDVVNPAGELEKTVLKKGIDPAVAEGELERLAAARDVALRQVLRWKVRYFTDGAAVGSRVLVDCLFEQCRERFGAKRKNGARRMRGKAAGAAGMLWTCRDLRRGIG